MKQKKVIPALVLFKMIINIEFFLFFHYKLKIESVFAFMVSGRRYNWSLRSSLIDAVKRAGI